MYHQCNSRQCHHTEALNDNGPQQLCGWRESTMQDAEELWLQTFSAYRIQFACVHVGKYTPKSKRKVMWHFGLKNVASLQSGKVGSDCAVEEIKVSLRILSTAYSSL
uniref:Uncharacterized protein n=1 Tax=Ditylum brightwellii TaxID=49249 RepID=A0A7S4W1S8_9STRA|mmetsp:Transcript_14720/g.20813  ORF Transcript_14720/g.20813 Transcript_14720/m.20813 type:complete len:107 (+) Transcript_14720:92-412(+)